MSCVAVKTDIVIHERGTFNQVFEWLAGDDETPVDLTGYTAVFTVREKMEDAAALLSATEGSAPWEADGNTGVYFDDGAEGKYRLYINDTDTQGLCATHKSIGGVYDLFLVSADGEVVLKQYGKCTIYAAVAR
jgi:hypothetical protein